MTRDALRAEGFVSCWNHPVLRVLGLRRILTGLDGPCANEVAHQCPLMTAGPACEFAQNSSDSKDSPRAHLMRLLRRCIADTEPRSHAPSRNPENSKRLGGAWNPRRDRMAESCD